MTSGAFDAFHRMFGIRYPFGDYDQAFVPEFNAGAMENPGCVTFRDEFIFRGPVPDGERSTRARVIVHEMAHMWFGDLVTMQWWDDLWLNESFAEYMGHRVVDEATRFRDAWVDFAFERKRWGLLADQRTSSHPVAGNGAVDARTALTDFDGISYAKGAAVLKQLATYLGDDVFLAGRARPPEPQRLRQRDARRPAGLLGAGRRRWPGRLGAGLAPRGRCGHPAGRGRHVWYAGHHPGRRARPRPHGVTVQRIAPDGDVETEALAVTADRTAAPPTPPPRTTCCCPTRTTRPGPRRGSTRGRSPHSPSGCRASPTRSRAARCGCRCATPTTTRSLPPPTRWTCSAAALPAEDQDIARQRAEPVGRRVRAGPRPGR